MPKVDDYINALRRFKYFSILDFANGYLQIKLAEKEREKTAFITEDGNYQFKRLPIGLMNSPYYFQRLINQYGLPQTIQTDNKKNFVSQQFKNFTKKYTIRHITSALYNPKAQGLVERTNRTLSDRLRI